MVAIAYAMMHDGIAIVSGVKEMAIDEQEAKLVGGAVANLMAQYNRNIDPRALAWVSVGSALMAVEAPRIMLVKDALNEKRKAREQRPAFEVVK